MLYYMYNQVLREFYNIDPHVLYVTISVSLIEIWTKNFDWNLVCNNYQSTVTNGHRFYLNGPTPASFCFV